LATSESRLWIAGAEESRLSVEGRCSRAAQEGIDARHKFPVAKWFGDVVIGAHLKTVDDVSFPVSGGEHDDGDAAVLADALADFEAVHVRHHDVQKHKVWRILRDRREGVSPVVGGH
jgi:hypothetical protein